MSDLFLKNNKRPSPIALLLQLGRKKTFVTIDDILQFFPEAEEDIDQLDRAFAALICAGIPYDEGVDASQDSEN